MGIDRALITVRLQSLLMGGIRSYGDLPGVAALRQRVLATAASLDYVLMLAAGSAGARIPAADAQRALHEGFERAVDDALLLLAATMPPGDAAARSFVREGIATVRAAIEAELRSSDERSFALIAITNDAGA